MTKLILKKSSAQDDKENDKEVEGEEKNNGNTQDESLPKEYAYAFGHPKDLIIDDPA